MLFGGSSSRKNLYSNVKNSSPSDFLLVAFIFIESLLIFLIFFLLLPIKFISVLTDQLLMSEVRRFFSIYGIVFLFYMVIYLIARFFTVVMFDSGWNVGILEWGFMGLVMVVFLHFFVIIAIPKSAIFLGHLILGRRN